MMLKHWRKVRYALQGLRVAWKDEASFRVQLFVALAVLMLGWYLGITRTEFLFVLFMIGFVLTAELFNTALEELCNKFKAEHDPHIAKIKDLAASAVLISSILALIVGIVIYVPYILTWSF